MKFILASFCFLLLTVFTYGQNMHISGNVQDTTKNIPLQNALAVVVRISDSLLIDFSRTNSAGNFEFSGLVMGDYHMIVSHPKFGEREYYFFGSPDNYIFELKKIILPAKSQIIDEVTIFAYKDPVFYKGDTLVFVADSFATKPNAMVEDLLKKLPGVIVNPDGSITNQGKAISKVLVDGDEFFGTDPTIATKNIAAKSIDQVHVYEKTDENDPGNEEKIQVLDLKLKAEAKKGQFGRASAATDFQRFYEGELLFNRFNNKQKISVFALGSNTLYSSISNSDARTYGISDNSGNSGNNGIPQTIKTGVYYNDQLTSKLKINASYTYNNTILKTEKSSFSQYFLEDTTYSTSLTSNTRNKTDQHAMNVSLEYKLDSLNTLQFSERLNYRLSNTENNNNTDFSTADDLLSRRTAIRTQNNSDNISSNTTVGWRKNFIKKRRSFNANYQLAYSDANARGYLYSFNQFITAVGQNDTIDQLKTERSRTVQHNLQAIYNEPLTTKIKLQFDYNFNLNQNDQTKNSFDQINGSYILPDPALSNQFETDKMENRFGIGLDYDGKIHDFNINVKTRNVSIENRNLISGLSINQSVFNLLPSARYVYAVTKTNRLTVNYRTNSSQPSINQLQPVQDNSNPNRVVIGNPDLLPNYTHSGIISYSVFKTISSQFMNISFNQSFVQKAFASAVNYDELGRTVTQTVNVDGNNSTAINFSGGMNIYKQILSLRTDLRFNNSHNNNFVNGEKNKTTNQSYNFALNLGLTKDSIEITLNGDFGYTIPKSSINTASNKPYYTNTYFTKLIWIMPYRFRFNTDLGYTINSRRAAGYNINYFIWNASIEKAFGQKENLSVGINIYDIFNQNISNIREVNTNVITDTKTDIISRYFLIKLKYQFNSTNNTKKDENFGPARK